MEWAIACRQNDKNEARRQDEIGALISEWMSIQQRHSTDLPYYTREPSWTCPFPTGVATVHVTWGKPSSPCPLLYRLPAPLIRWQRHTATRMRRRELVRAANLELES